MPDFYPSSAAPAIQGRSAGARGQSTVEFALVSVILFPFIMVLMVLMLNLAQSWSLAQAVATLGDTITTTGTYDEGEFIANSGSLGFPVNSGSDSLVITVTESDNSQVSYTWGADDFAVRYGDIVSIQSTKDLRVGVFANLMGIFSLPNAEASWTGVAQRNTEDIGADPTEIPTTGEVTGTVRDAADGSVIEDVVIDFGSGHVATTSSTGRYGISNLPAGNYTVMATKTGYQDASASVTVASGVTTARDFAMESAAIVDVYVSSSSPANHVVNGDFEDDDTGWVNGAQAFDVTTYLPHAGSYSAVLGVESASGGGIYQVLPYTLSAGATYRATAWITAESGAPISMLLGQGGSTEQVSTTGTGDWQEVSVSWTPGTDSSNVMILIQGDEETGGPPTRIMYVDDISVSAVAGAVNSATVTTEDGLTATPIGNGHYRLVVAPGPVSIRVNAPGGLRGEIDISHVAPGTTTYVYIDIS